MYLLKKNYIAYVLYYLAILHVDTEYSHQKNTYKEVEDKDPQPKDTS